MRPVLVLTLAAVLVLTRGASAELVAHYPINEGGGTVTADASGHGNHGTIVDADWIAGAHGMALYFDGSRDGYVNCGQDSSLDIEATGSVLVWFKPDTFYQGGIVCWGPGGSWPEQRFITILNDYGNYEELGVYLGDGVDYFRPYRGPFPPFDEWTYLSVTFTARSIDIYLDGNLVASTFQQVKPELTGQDLLIGKTYGWVPVGQFRGLIDEVRVYDHCLSAGEVFALYKAEAHNRGKDTSGFGRIGIAARSCAPQGTIEVDLDYRGLAPTPADMTIEVKLSKSRKRGSPGRPIATVPGIPPGTKVHAGPIASRPAEPRIAVGKVRLPPVWGDAAATIPMCGLPSGNYKVHAQAYSNGVPVGDKSTATLFWPGRASGWDGITVLNNLCWELLNESPGANPDPQYSINSPRSGWVFCRTEATGSIALELSGAKPARIHDPAGSQIQATMRWIEQGSHTITVNGTGSLDQLIVRSVPVLLFAHWPYKKIGLTQYEDHNYLAAHVLPQANSILSSGVQWYTNAWVNQIGGEWYSVVYKPLAEVSGTTQGIYDYLVASQGMTHPDLKGILIDEFYPGVPFLAEWTEACRKLLSDPQFSDRKIIPYCGSSMWDDPACREFLQTIVGAGITDSGPRMAWMFYFPELETEDRAWASVNKKLTDALTGLDEIVPDPVEKMIVVLSYLTEFAGEDAEPCADLKVFMDMQFELLATDPAFFGLAGIEEYVSHHSDEESIRWAARLIRHYVLEGNTERLSPHPYTLEHIQNGDLVDGFDGWTVEAAETDSVDVKQYKGLGILEHRRSYGHGTIVPFVWMRRSNLAPNRVSQTIEGFEIGELYTLELITGDYQDLVSGASYETLHDLSIDIDGAAVLNGAEYDFQQAGPSVGAYGPFDQNNPYWMNLHRRVFRPTCDIVILTLSDWVSPFTPGGPIGQELFFDHIEVQPYYLDNP